jgi:hypothetical protein
VGKDLVASASVPGGAGEKRGRLAGRFAVPDRDQRVSSFLERRLAALVSGQVKRVCAPKEQLRPLVIERPERERLLVVSLGRAVGIQREGAVARAA